MRTDKLGKYMITVLFLLLAVVVGLKSSPLKKAYALLEAVMPSGQDAAAAAEGQDGAQEPAAAVNDVLVDFNEDIYQQTLWIDLNGAMARMLGMRGMYKKLGMYTLGGGKSGYIVSGAAQTSTDYEYEQITALKEFLDARGIQLLYVNAPTKYLDDQLLLEEFGISCYSNQNADLFLRRITEAGISNLDLRKELQADGKDIYDMFYRTDHHWTTDSGLWAAQKVAEKLNEEFGYDIAMADYDEGSFQKVLYEECWLGEQGRKVAKTYTGLDDFIRIEPSYDTNFTMTTAYGTTVSGDFSIFIDEDSYRFGGDVYHAPSMHYSYIRSGISQTKIVNEDVSDGKILLLGDSYSQVVVPFLSLGVSQVDSLILRSYPESLREYIDDGDYDTVIILYAQFMIGAHDDAASANFSMFDLE